MKVYIVIDDEEELDNAEVFQNKTKAEKYMIKYIFKHYDTEVIPSKEEVLAIIRENGYFEAVQLIEKRVK